MTKKQRIYFQQKFINNKGQNYPCSNQIVTCGIFTQSIKKAEEYMQKYNALLKRKGNHQRVWLLNNELWYWFSPLSFTQRGYRFYKIKIEKSINITTFKENIYPCCCFYCSELKFI